MNETEVTAPPQTKTGASLPLAMCALGLCAMRGGAKSSRDDEKAAPKAAEQAASPPQVQREP